MIDAGVGGKTRSTCRRQEPGRHRAPALLVSSTRVRARPAERDSTPVSQKREDGDRSMPAVRFLEQQRARVLARDSRH